MRYFRATRYFRAKRLHQERKRGSPSLDVNFFPKLSPRPKIFHRRYGLAAPGSLRMRLTVQSVTTIIPKHEAKLSQVLENIFRASFETVEKLLVLFNRNNYFYRYIYVMNKVFPKDCFAHVCQLGYRLKMITKRVQDKCNCQTFNVLGIYLYRKHCFIV